MRKPLKKEAALVCFSLYLGLLIVEILLRSWTSYPGFSEGYAPSYNPRLVYELEPGFTSLAHRNTISAQGMNDRLYLEKKPEGTFRIALVSDSVGFGWLVGVEKSYPKVLERLLNQRKPIFEVLNFSVPGYNTSQEAEVVKTKVLRFQPDLLILGFTPNDLGICNWIQPEIGFFNYFFHRSHLLHWVVFNFERLLPRLSCSALCQKGWTYFKKEGFGQFFGSLPIIRRTGLVAAVPEMQDARFVPEKYGYMVGSLNYRKHLAAIQQTSKDAGVRFISAGLFTPDSRQANEELGISNTLDYLENLSRVAKLRAEDESTYRIPQDGHLTELGNRRVAEIIFEYLTKGQFVP